MLHQVRWKCFPHVCREALADGYYDALEALQGQQATYMCRVAQAHATTPLEVVEIKEVRIKAHMACNELREAIDTAREAFARGRVLEYGATAIHV